MTNRQKLCRKLLTVKSFDFDQYNAIHLNQNMYYRTIKKEVFIWIDSEFKDIYEIDSDRTWLEQKENIITKLLPPLYKKKKRAQAANYLIENNDKYIRRYPKKKLVRIFKESGYHSEEWEETDSDEENDIIGKESAVKEKTISIHIYKTWWRSSALQHLLHDWIDPTVEKLRKKPRILKIKRVQRCKTTTSMPPVDTPNWCLTDEVLKRFNRSTNEIPTYDYNTDQDEEIDEYHNDEYENKKIKNKKNKKSKKRGLFLSIGIYTN
ncbi:hypothetical protein GLOIN_2v1849195 [Rhizophagus irregularis DAOM 181602=DAOM 197198]|uniref:Uncharacterized protein n=1 Tax=Rhizophagus irregularis (strain DAOM 181602 / DAOM 197198 / MUCL 43194) TaxID=747089 RepID=A0A2P4NVE4_RHIID|nr:hypothetical protein GLOIN_2v1849195 [Rhizophagus irregularis DAOM 181602=DAOM 197198]POG57100.1 hypothetical protein GLOIN_2v1849195 [Rhizophagus irregularis DAOM 181602=DAOM 197198]|eukprot:XP_025164383.1 hypothetical protein GLOIN_2v1849195 [Rhizophagus irregularis DAOM 181602=DAOM 197198]